MKTNIPLVSVAIITYNQKDYLKECIESILCQDYKNIEIIIADDCSTDGTQIMLKEYDFNYPNKFVLKLSTKNQGITKNSNLAHFACSGKYIAWMGGDDLMLPGKIKKQVDFFESHNECAICYHNLDVFDSDTKKTLYFYNSKLKLNGDISKTIKYGTFNGACSTMVRRNQTPSYGFDERIIIASDWLYWVETLANGGSINYIDEVLGKYRRHSNNITKFSSKLTQNDIDHLNSINIILFKYPKYFKEIMYRYSQILINIRHKVSYPLALFKSFCIAPTFKSFAGFLVYFITIGRKKL